MNILKTCIIKPWNSWSPFFILFIHWKILYPYVDIIHERRTRWNKTVLIRIGNISFFVKNSCLISELWKLINLLHHEHCKKKFWLFITIKLNLYFKQRKHFENWLQQWILLLRFNIFPVKEKMYWNKTTWTHVSCFLASVSF